MALTYNLKLSLAITKLVASHLLRHERVSERPRQLSLLERHRAAVEAIEVTRAAEGEEPGVAAGGAHDEGRAIALDVSGHVRGEEVGAELIVAEGAGGERRGSCGAAEGIGVGVAVDQVEQLAA